MDHERSVPPELTHPLPEDVARQLSWLAHLIDERITVRGVGSGVCGFVSAFLGTDDVRVTTHDLGGLTRQLVTLALAADLELAAGLRGAEAYDSPSFETLDLGEQRVRVPRALAAAFPTGTLAPCPLVVILDEDWQGDSILSIHSATAEVDAAKAYLEDLLGRARANNPFRGKALEVQVRQGCGLTFRVLDLAPVGRADVSSLSGCGTTSTPTSMASSPPATS